MVSAVTGERARSQLVGTRFADVRWVDETGSTNDDALALARAGAPEGVVVVADAQTAGRGRLGRSWQAPPGSSLLMSVLLRPPLGPHQAHLVTAAVACAAAAACHEVSGVEPTLKWPNDLVIEAGPIEDGPSLTGTKLAGVLAESLVDKGELTAVVVGIGINVNWPDDVPTELAEVGVALNRVTGREIDREDLLIVLLRELEPRVAALATESGRAELIAEHRSRCSTLGKQVRVVLNGETVEGEAIDLTDDGHLLLRPNDADPNAPREITTGDVIHLRAR